MIRGPTVFITGAGASCHFGYPTGEQLVGKVIAKAERMQSALEALRTLGAFAPKYVLSKAEHSQPHNLLKAWREVEREAMELSDRLKRANPTLIDSFLGFNTRLQGIGKLLIAWVILEAEALNPISEKENWCRFIVQKLTSGCRASADLLSNNVTFVTFNYDVSLELRIRDALSAHEFFGADDIENFVATDRFIHVYGSVRDGEPIGSADTECFGLVANNWNPTAYKFLENYCRCMDVSYSASRRIKTVSPDDKDDNMRAIAAARAAIASANYVYLLGYGFDRTNSERLEFREHLGEPDVDEDEFGRRTRKQKCVMFTNFEDRNQVNKRASDILFGRHGRLLSGQSPIYGDLEYGYYVEKSTRRVYEALALDFDDLECSDC